MKKKPNVVIFFTDQQRWDTTGVHGNPCGLTPNFDKMAQEGTHVYNAFTPPVSYTHLDVYKRQSAERYPGVAEERLLEAARILRQG